MNYPKVFRRALTVTGQLTNKSAQSINQYTLDHECEYCACTVVSVTENLVLQTLQTVDSVVTTYSSEDLPHQRRKTRRMPTDKVCERSLDNMVVHAASRRL